MNDFVMTLINYIVLLAVLGYVSYLTTLRTLARIEFKKVAGFICAIYLCLGLLVFVLDTFSTLVAKCVGFAVCMLVGLVQVVRLYRKLQ